MIYIVCDMNCNNFGNRFEIIGHERKVKQDKSGYFIEGAHYPKGHCYRAKGVEPILGEYHSTFVYSQAIDYLIPEDYVRWQKTRFGKEIL